MIIEDKKVKYAGKSHCALVVQLSLTLCDPLDCSPPGSSTPEISQARILEWVAISFSRESSRPRDQTCGQVLYRLSHQESLLNVSYLPPP